MATEIRTGTILGALHRVSDIGLAFALVGIVIMMVVPLPSFLLDILLTFNIAFTLIILLVGMYINQPLQFSIFPSLLLVVTLFRLALNISGTRLILLNGYAGEVINSFGSFVLGGNYVVGMVVFLILVVIQFVVVTNGAQRIAEVAARFTLDAMPGKQMSIDADFNAGLINEEQAREKRREIEREADFYGAMDGASKFIRGDAIAAIIIIVVNIIGGLIIGVWQKGMPIMEALGRYTLLTVGEGLVTQIPALLVSTAAGIIVARSASDVNLGRNITEQILSRPRALAIAAALLLFMVGVPGLPKLPFLIMGISVAVIARIIHNATRDEETAAVATGEETQAPVNFNQVLEIEPLEINLGGELLPLADPKGDRILQVKITTIRTQCATDLGIVVPLIRIHSDTSLGKDEFTIKLFGCEVTRYAVMLDRQLAIETGMVSRPLEGVPTTEPSFKVPAHWIVEDEAESAREAGYWVVAPIDVISTHLFEIIKRHAHELLTRQEVQTLINRVRLSNAAVVEELVPNLMGIGDIQKVLQNLLKESISIRNLEIILETLASQCKNTKDLDVLTELVRHALARQICREYRLPDDRLMVLTVDPRLEQELLEALRRSQKDIYTSIEPATIRAIYRGILTQAEKVSRAGGIPIAVTSAAARMHFKRLANRVMPNLVVLSYNEILPEIKVESVGMITLEYPPGQSAGPAAGGLGSAMIQPALGAA